MKKASTLFFIPFLFFISNSDAQITFENIQNFEFQDEVAYLRGVSWIDADNDFDLDVMVTGSSGIPPNTINETAIYINNGDDTFTNTGLLSLDQVGSFGHGWADIDNDGDEDVYIAATWNFGGINELWLNDGGSGFTEITNSGSTPNVASPYEGNVSWGDYDNDGFVDLFLPRWNQQSNIVYRNNGDGTFSNVNLGALTTDNFWTSGAIWGDYDNDQDLDIYVFNYQNNSGSPGENHLFENNGDGTFTKNINAGGIVTDTYNTRTANFVDANNDGWMDVFCANQSADNQLYLNNGDGTFSTQTITGSNTTWSSNWGDYDNDGDEDLLILGASSSESAFFENDGLGNLTDISNLHPTIFPLPFSGSLSNGVIFMDYDNDGWLDMHITQPNTASDLFLRNQGADCISWLKIKCTGIQSNRSAIGTTVRAKATINGNAVWQMRQVSAQTSKPGQNPQWLHFGFDDAPQVDSLIFEWPSGEVCIFTNVEVNQFVEILEDCSVNTIIPGPEIPGENELISLCPEDIEIQLQAPSEEPGGTWSSSCGECLDENGLFNTTGLASGDYEHYYSLGGICGFRDTVFVTIAPLPELLVSNDTTVLSGTELSLFASGASTYLWEPGSVLSCDDCSNPSFTAMEEIVFQVLGINEFGCEDSATITISIIEEPDFEFPNVFTPDNDGNNDVFNAKFDGEIFETYQLSIFNRWGSLVFESENPAEGWDGTNENELLPSDVYLYIFDYLLVNGNTGQEKGDITLIR